MNRLWLCFILVVLLVGCGRSTIDTSMPSLTHITDVSTPLPVPSQVLPSSTPSLTIQPSNPTPYSLPTIINVTATPSIAPTLDLDARNAYLLDWLQNAEHCTLPCWLEIIPGESVWNELEPLFYHLGAIVSNEPMNNYTFHGIGGFNQEEYNIDTTLHLYEQNGKITSMDVHSNGWSEALSVFRAMWQSYSPEAMIANYGCPSQVWVLSESRPSNEIPYPDQIYYRIWLDYGNMDWVIEYSGIVDYEPVYQVCPTFLEQGNLGQGLRIEIWSSESMNILINKTLNHGAQLALEAASGMSVETFCSLFTQESKPICFETPRDIWP